jgi:reactive intermediate/imine deaminase
MALQKQIISANKNIAYPFSPAVVAGGFVHISGTIATDDNGQLVPGDIREQTRRTLDRISTLLKQAGSSLYETVSVQVYLRNAADFPAMNEIYRDYWNKYGNYVPARTTVAANMVLPGALIEVSVIAVTAVSKDKARLIALPSGWQPSPNPYSYGVKTGNTLFMSGLLARNPKDNSLAARDIRSQTRAVMENAGAILAAHHMTYADIVSSRVYITDGANFQAMNEVYRSFFPKDPPARATVVTGLMSPDFLVEISFLAVRSEDRTAFTTPQEDGSAGRPNPNFSSAIRVGNRLYLSGMMGVKEANKGNAGLQTEETLAAIGRTLRIAGFDWAHVVDGVVYLTDMNDFQAMNQAYRKTFHSEFPARATVGTGLVAPDGLVEIMLLAVKE